MNLFDNSVPDPEGTAGEVVVDNEPVEQVEETEEPEVSKPVEAESAEVEEQSTEAEEVEEEGAEEVYIINGEEFTKEDLKHAKDYKHLEAGFTKKTMALAEVRKDLESKADSLDKLTQELSVLVNEDSEINWSELKEDDPDEYIRLKERSDKRKEALKNAQSNLKPQGLSQEQLAIELKVLSDNNPDWFEKDSNGNPIKGTDQYKGDIQDLINYAVKLGFTNDEISQFQRAPMIQLLLDSMRAEKKSKEASDNIKIAKKNVAPKSTKPAKVAPKQQPNTLFSKSIGS